MKIAYFTNFLFHHQYPLCELMMNEPDVEFTYVCTEEMTKERKSMGYEDLSSLPFVIRSYENAESYQKAMEVAKTADVCLFGSTPPEFIYERMKLNKLTFRYCERALRKGEWRRFIPITAYKIYKQYIRYSKKNLYILSASSYTSHDLALCGFDINKCFKWGYLPKVTKYENFDEIMSQKRPNHIVWVGRFIECKHPEFAIEGLKKIKEKGIAFTCDFIGNGPLLGASKTMVADADLDNHVKFLGALKPDEVREHMEKASIFIFNSDRYEGWGAVVNEAMNAGCAVLVSHVVGSAPFLIQRDVNGRVYKYNNSSEFTSSLIDYLTKPELVSSLGRGAYNTMTDTWNIETAVPRFLEIVRAMQKGISIPVFPIGPCSKANDINTDWYEK